MSRLGHLCCMMMLILWVSVSWAQRPDNPPAGVRSRGGEGMTLRVYGKILDSTTHKPLEYAVVRITQNDKLINGALTVRNGDFSIDKIPAQVSLSLEVSLVGYKNTVFPLQIPVNPGAFISEKDLGNFMLPLENQSALIVKGESNFKMEFDKRIYDVENNAMNAGGTAEDVLKNIPSVQVDQDGNVSVRNTPPQIMIDGRPTTLTIDQIPADAIQKVEIITNPSAKYDASGGGGGIINIVMKHNRGMGYNGNVKLGTSTMPPDIDPSLRKYPINGGFDVNVRQGKINVFANFNLNQRRSYMYGSTVRNDLVGTPLSSTQTQISLSNGYMMRGSAGVDFFLDNRNTITVSESYNKGAFQPDDSMYVDVDTLDVTSNNGFYYRKSKTERVFQNLGTSVLYKHLFAKEGTELTADFNYNAISSHYNGDYKNVYDQASASIWKQNGSVKQNLYTFQSDFVSKINDRFKFEAGARGSFRTYDSGYENLRFDGTQYIANTNLSVNYGYTDQVYAAYSTVSMNTEKWKYQMGLRAESSFYRGELKDTTVSFSIKYPISLFPSLYITRVISESSDIQLALNRRINRPGFMQLSPFTDYSDSLNVMRGNPALRPEFTQAAELSYLGNFNRKYTFIATVYARYTNNVTVRQQVLEYSPVLQDSVIINTYLNASSSIASGIELVSKNSFTEWMDITANVNLYNSTINGTNINPNLTNSINSYWIKLNSTFKLPNSLTMQINGDYSSKKAMDVGSSERGGGGGGGMGGMGGGMGGGMYGGSGNTAQGYVRPSYGVDISFRKGFIVGKGNNATKTQDGPPQRRSANENLTVSVAFNDILHTRIQSTYNTSYYFTQDSQRYRDYQTVRLNLTWKFGKMDQSLFRRKNTKTNSEGEMG